MRIKSLEIHALGGKFRMSVNRRGSVILMSDDGRRNIAAKGVEDDDALRFALFVLGERHPAEIRTTVVSMMKDSMRFLKRSQ
jgi:hypothetical protein